MGSDNDCRNDATKQARPRFMTGGHWSSVHIPIPSEAQSHLDRYLIEHGTSSFWELTDQDLATEPVFIFSDMKATANLKAFSGFHAPILLTVDAQVTNNSMKVLSESDMPLLFCAETRELILCTMKGSKLAPRENTQVTYKILARDIFYEWLFFLSTPEGSFDWPRISGAEKLPELIASELQDGFLERKASIEKQIVLFEEEGVNTKWLHNMIDNSVIVAQSGSCFHHSAECGSIIPYASTSMRVRDAYRYGYRPCYNCIGSDWWTIWHQPLPERECSWLVSCAGELIAWWPNTSFDKSTF